MSVLSRRVCNRVAMRTIGAQSSLEGSGASQTRLSLLGGTKRGQDGRSHPLRSSLAVTALKLAALSILDDGG